MSERPTPTKQKRCKSAKYEPCYKNGRKEQRQDQAHQRNLERIDRTPREQIERLDNKLGKGVGAVKERKRLKKALQKKKVSA